MTNPIDECHCNLIQALVECIKPEAVLEIGYGEGRSFGAIWRGILHNEIPCSYTLVDDWRAHGGKPPPELNPEAMNICSMTEEDFYRVVTPVSFGDFDLILSDADHGHAELWLQRSYRLLREGGVLIYHDVTNPNHPNLREMIARCTTQHLNHLVFNRSSRPDEECERGLLVIFKP